MQCVASSITPSDGLDQESSEDSSGIDASTSARQLFLSLGWGIRACFWVQALRSRLAPFLTFLLAQHAEDFFCYTFTILAFLFGCTTIVDISPIAETIPQCSWASSSARYQGGLYCVRVNCWAGLMVLLWYHDNRNHEGYGVVLRPSDG